MTPADPRKPNRQAGGPARIERFVALLRGVNVGGKNLLPMRSLVPLAEEAGCQRVSTYLQSGNLLFEAPVNLVPGLPGRLSELLQRELDLQVPVVLRSQHELLSVVDGNPFLERGEAPGILHVAFLQARPQAEAVRSLDPDRSPPDRFEVHGSDIYLCCPNGLGRTKLSNAYFDTRLRTVSTVRSWKTVVQLLGLLDSL